jgi:hypothetical protein
MRVGDLGKLLVEWRQSGQQRQQRFRRSGLDYQPLTLLAHDGVFAGKLELPRDPHRLISVVPEELGVPLGHHSRRLVGIGLGLCQVASPV